MRLLILAALACVLTACGGPPPDWLPGARSTATSATSTPQTTARRTTTPRAPSTTLEPTSTTAATAAAGAAADGTDYAACRDGTCEVYVSGRVVIPLAPKFGFTRFEVTCSGGQTAVFGGDPERGNVRAQIGGTGELNSNGITMTVLVVDQKGAVLRFRPRT